MYELNEQEIIIINSALNMALASTKRMQTAKPKYHTMFQQEITDITAIQMKLSQQPKRK